MDEILSKVENCNHPPSFSWDLHYSCNYRCPYCWWEGRWQQLKVSNRNLSPGEWFMHWQNIYNRYGTAQIEILGGEPFIYPDFVTLIKKISSLHTIRITTNLSTNIDVFLKVIDSSRVKVSPTFHPAFADLNVFIAKCRALKEKGFTDNVTYLAYPPQIQLIPHYKDKFNQEGLSLSVMTFWGRYNNKDYPTSYTEQEREIINIALGKRNNQEFQIIPKTMERGRLCAAGHRYAVIQADGTVLRCGGSDLNEKIGNFFDPAFRLQERPLPCNAEHCKCNEWALLQEEDETKLSAVAERKEVKKIDFPPYRVFFTWDIHYACNYKCSYCLFAKKWDTMSKENTYPGINKWIEVWSNIYDQYSSCHVHISGGEPFIYPDFIELVVHLTKYHTVEFDTNLSFDVQRFMSKVKPGKVRFAPAFHPELTDLEEFIQKAVALRTNGYNLEGVNYVAYPLQLEKMKEYKNRFEEYGIGFTIMPFRGEFKGREYPSGYTTEEAYVLEACGYHAVSKKMIEWYGQGTQDERRGKICRMGQTYAKIHANGNAYRCCMIQESGLLGNLLEGTFKLYNAPRLCEYVNCSCFKAMIVGNEKDWFCFWKDSTHF